MVKEWLKKFSNRDGTSQSRHELFTVTKFIYLSNIISYSLSAISYSEYKKLTQISATRSRNISPTLDYQGDLSQSLRSAEIYQTKNQTSKRRIFRSKTSVRRLATNFSAFQNPVVSPARSPKCRMKVRLFDTV